MEYKSISFFALLCYNFYGDNMEVKNIKDELLILKNKINDIWRLL